MHRENSKFIGEEPIADSKELPAVLLYLIAIINNKELKDVRGKEYSVLCRVDVNCASASKCHYSKTEFCECGQRVYYTYSTGGRQYQCSVSYKDGIPCFQDEVFCIKGLEEAQIAGLQIIDSADSDDECGKKRLKLAFVKSVWETHAWHIDDLNCLYPSQNIKDMHKCFYYTIPESLGIATDFLLKHPRKTRDYSTEIEALQEAVLTITKLYNSIIPKTGDTFQEYPDNYEIMMRPELQGVFSMILNQNNGFNEENAANYLVPIFESAITACYDSVRDLINNNEERKEDLKKLLGDTVLFAFQGTELGVF